MFIAAQSEIKHLICLLATVLFSKENINYIVITLPDFALH